MTKQAVFIFDMGDEVKDVGFVWECGLCDEKGNAHYSDGAYANLMNHIAGGHITVVQGLGAGGGGTP